MTSTLQGVLLPLKTQINKVKTQINKNHNPQTQRHAHNYKDKILESKPKTQPSFFQQLHRDKTQRHSTITQRQNSTQIILGFLRNQTQNSKLKSQINEQNPRSKTTNNHRFREKERESWVFGHGLRERGLSFWPERVGVLAKIQRERKLSFRP